MNLEYVSEKKTTKRKIKTNKQRVKKHKTIKKKKPKNLIFEIRQLASVLKNQWSTL